MKMNVKEFTGVNVSQMNTELICKQLLKHSKYNAVFILNTEGVIMGISEGAQSTYGYTYEEVCGKYFDFLFTKEDRCLQKPEHELASVLHHGNAADNNNIVHKDGHYIETEGESLLITDLWGDSFIIKNIHAVDKQIKLQRNLQKQNEKLLRINNDLDTFVFTASHDLKNPLSNIESLISIVQAELHRGASADTLEPIISHITEALARLRRTVNELTVISKVDADCNGSETYIYFEELLEEVKTDLQDLITETGAIIHTRFREAPGILFSIKNLRSILFNLLSNALKYRSPDRAPVIYIDSKTEECYLLLTIRDNGIGIDSAQHKDVFDFFKRLHTHIEGSGVGMGIVKKIMDNAEGKITLESTPYEGSVFTLHFKQY